MPTEHGPISAAWDNLLLTLGGPPLADGNVSEGSQMAAAKLTPVTVFSGFLGAGKTTLLCELLQRASINIVAIVNDIASINVDAAMVRSKNAETIELENGCACCVLGNDLRETLDSIGRRPQLPDAIVIEASGISDPTGIALTVGNVASMTLDGIVTVVDALTCQARMDDPVTSRLFARQLAAAHLIMLTKTSAYVGGVTEIRDQIGRLTPGRPVVMSDGLFEASDMGVEMLLGAATRGARPDSLPAKHGYDGFAVEEVEWTEPVCSDGFFALLDDLPDAVYRLKGWVCLREIESQDATLTDSNIRYEVQAAGAHWRVTEQAGEARNSQLIVIGRSNEMAFLTFVDRLRGLCPGR